MKTKIEIISSKYFGQESGSQEWNSKVVYSKNGKTYVAQVYLDLFHQEVYKPSKQEKGHKLLHGVLDALHSHIF